MNTLLAITPIVIDLFWTPAIIVVVLLVLGYVFQLLEIEEISIPCYIMGAGLFWLSTAFYFIYFIWWALISGHLIHFRI